MFILHVKEVKVVDLMSESRILLFKKANKSKLNDMEIQASVFIM